MFSLLLFLILQVPPITDGMGNIWANNLVSLQLFPVSLQAATLVPGTTGTYTDGTNTWAGNPFCGETGFLLQPTSPAIDAGAPIPDFHCPQPGSALDQPRMSNGEFCREWYGNGPDIGACEFVASVAPPPPPTQWVLCANENEFCAFSGTRQVRYGAQGVFAFGTFTDGVLCANEIFGDPLVGVVKACEYEQVTSPAPSAPSNLTIQP
jgi:hypothetical protein